MAERSLRDLKRQVKYEKKARKRKNKREKVQSKLQKERTKIERKRDGVTKAKPEAKEELSISVEEEESFEPAVDEAISEESTTSVEWETAEEEEEVELDWSRSSIIPMTEVEKRIDELANFKPKSSIADVFAQKYGEDLVIPEASLVVKLSEEQKRTLAQKKAESQAADAKERATLEAAAKKSSPKAAASPKKAKAAKPVGDYPAWHIKSFPLVSKNKTGIAKIIMLIIPDLLPMLGIQLLLTIIMSPILLIKGRKAKKSAA